MLKVVREHLVRNEKSSSEDSGKLGESKTMLCLGNWKELREGRMLPCIEGLFDARLLLSVWWALLSHLAEEKFETREVKMSKNR